MRTLFSLILSFVILIISCRNTQNNKPNNTEISSIETLDTIQIPAFAKSISEASFSLTLDNVVYDPTYFNIKYPNGDVPADKGVCTDVVIRTFRKLHIDLQKEVHEDMQANFSKYPKKWGLKKTDTNIDHRRVPNLMMFFSRHGQVKKNSENGLDYMPGDIVSWDLGGGLTHIGMVVNKLSSHKKRYLIVHNIGRGQEISDCLFEYKITGHYFYTGKSAANG